MSPRNHHRGGRRQTPHSPSRASGPRPVPAPFEKKPPVVYDKPFVLLEDAQKNVFIFKAGQLIQHAKKIAEYRQDSRVKELPQKINDLTRYEIQCPRSEAGDSPN